MARYASQPTRSGFFVDCHPEDGNATIAVRIKGDIGFDTSLFEGEDAVGTQKKLFSYAIGGNPVTLKNVNGGSRQANTYDFSFHPLKTELMQLASASAEGKLLAVVVQSSGGAPALVINFLMPIDNAPLQQVVAPCLAGVKASETMSAAGEGAVKPVQSSPKSKARWEIRGLTSGLTPEEVAAAGRAAGMDVSTLSQPTRYAWGSMNLTDPGFRHSGEAQAGSHSLQISVLFSAASHKSMKVIASEGAADFRANASMGRMYDAGVDKWGKPQMITLPRGDTAVWGDYKTVHAQYEWVLNSPGSLVVVDPADEAASEAVLFPKPPKPKI